MFTELEPGTVTGTLRLVRRIGAGAMGSVWLAEHLTLGTNVAVKFIGDASMIGDELTLSRFMQEAALVAKLKSPYIVQVLDRAATQLGVPYIVMELVDGELLGRHLARRGSASLEVTRRVVDPCRSTHRYSAALRAGGGPTPLPPARAAPLA